MLCWSSREERPCIQGKRNLGKMVGTERGDQGADRLKVKGWKKIFHANGSQKKAGVAILISDKMNFKIKNNIRDKEGHYLMME